MPNYGIHTTEGNFDLNTTTGNQIIDLSQGADPGENEVKAVIFWGNRQTGPPVGNQFASNAYSFIGIGAQNAKQACIYWGADDGQAVSNVGCGYASASIIILPSNGNPSIDVGVVLVSFGTGANAGTITLNITAAPATPYNVRYLAISGSKVSSTIKEFTAETASLGLREDTGIGFKGALAFFMGRTSTTAGPGSNICTWFGAAARPTSMGSVWWGATDLSVGTESHYSNTNACIAIPTVAGTATDAVAGFEGFTKDGYVLRWTDLAASAWLYSVLVLTGMEGDVRNILAPASTGNQQILIAPSFAPLGIFTFGTGQTTADATVGAECHVCFGGSDGGGGESARWSSEDDITLTDANMCSAQATILFVATNPSTVAAQASMDTLTNGEYDFGWSVTRANSRFFAVAIGAEQPKEKKELLQFNSTSFSSGTSMVGY